MDFTKEELEKEEWRYISGYNYMYQISSLGRIRRLEHTIRDKNGYQKKIRALNLRPFVKGNGYFVIKLKGKHHYIHRLVAKNFIPNPLTLPQVNHIDLVKSNNRVSNLEWCDNSYNNKHSYELGERKRINKLWRKDLIIAKDMRNQGMMYKDIAKELGVCAETLRKYRKTDLEKIPSKKVSTPK